MKKRWGLILFVSLFIIGVVSWWWWKRPDSYLKNEAAKLAPKVSVNAINITDIDDDQIKVRTEVILSNPLPVDLNTNNIEYEIFIDSFKVIKSAYTAPIKIGASHDISVEMPMVILAEPLRRVLKSFEAQNSDSATYTMKANFQVDVPIAGNRHFDMEVTRRLPAFRVPTGKLEDIDINKLGRKETKLDMVMIIDNKNIFPLKLKDGKYKMTLDKDIEIEGALQKDIDIPMKSKTPVTLNMTMKTGEMVKFAWKALFEKKHTHFVINFTGKLDTDNKVVHNSRIVLNVKGTLDELKKVKNK